MIAPSSVLLSRGRSHPPGPVSVAESLINKLVLAAREWAGTSTLAPIISDLSVPVKSVPAADGSSFYANNLILRHRT
jgi:hypothetical protein